MEEIHDDALVSAEMILPRLLSNNLYQISTWKGIGKKIKRRKNGYKSKEQQQNGTKHNVKSNYGPEKVYLINPAFGVIELDIWLIMDPIQILMEPVQEERQQFLRVMLLIPVERRSVFSDNRTQFERHHGPTCAAPELTDQLSVAFGNHPAIADRICPVQLAEKEPGLEVMRQGTAVRNALDGRVEEARVAQIVESATAFFVGSVFSADTAGSGEVAVLPGHRCPGETAQLLWPCQIPIAYLPEKSKFKAREENVSIIRSDSPIDRLIDWLIDWSEEYSIRWLTVCLIDWSTNL